MVSKAISCRRGGRLVVFLLLDSWVGGVKAKGRTGNWPLVLPGRRRAPSYSC